MGQILSASRVLLHRPSRRIVVLAMVAAMLLTAIPVGRIALLNQDPPDYFVTVTSAQNQTAQVGDTFAESPAVRVCAFGSNPCQPVGGVNVTFAAPSSGASGTFADTNSHTTTVTSIASGDFIGMATAPAFTANDIVGTYHVTVTAEETFPERAQPNFIPFSNSELPATNVSQVSMAEGANQASQINTQFSIRLSVLAVDGSNSNLSGVEVTFEAPGDGPSGTFTGGSFTATVNTGSTGIATAPNFTANGELGEYFVTATVSGDQTVTGEPMSVPFAMRNTSHNPAGVPEVISVSAGGGQNVAPLTTYPTNIEVAIFDGSLNHVEGATVIFSLPDEGPSGTFANGSRTFEVTTGSNGLATASAITANTTVGQFSVDVSATKNDITANALIALSIGRVETTTTLSKDPSGDSVYGQPVEVTASVESVEGPYVPTGPVNFYRDGDVVDECTEVIPSGGDAICTFEFLPVDGYTFSAEYLGDDSSQPSTADPISHTVNKADTTLTLETSEPQFVLEGDSVTFTASVSVDPPGAGEPSGTVTFTSSDGTPLNGGDPVILVDGEAQVSTSDLDAGTPQITASYSGDDNFNDSNDDLTQNVYTVPEVTDHPSDTLALVDEQASFSAAASGFPNPDVQWQISTDDGETFVDIPNADEATYSFTAAFADDQHQFQAVFSNPAGSDTSDVAILTVRQLAEITSEDSTTFSVGEEGSFTVTATGILEPALSMDGDLPEGVTFDESTGDLSGVPAEGTGGVYSLTFTATNDVDPTAVQNFTLTVNEAPMITSDDSTTFEVGEEETFTVTAIGYPVPTLSLDGTLPGGVSFEASTGTLSGTPDGATGGSYQLTFTARNGIEPDFEQPFNLIVNQPPEITSDDTATFEVGSAGSFTVTATGYPAPGFSLDGELPAGLSLDADSGEISGTPAPGTGGIYQFEVTASNGVVSDSHQTFTMTVNEAPQITSADSTTFVFDAPGDFTFTATGFPEPSFSVSGTLPSGISFDDSDTLSGTPEEAGVFDITITAENGILPNATQQFTLTVDRAEQEELTAIVDPASGVTGDRLTLETTGGSGTGVVTFDTGSSDACELGVGADAGLLVIVDGTGTCEVIANKAGDDFYHSTTSEPVVVEVSRAEPTLTVESADGTYGGTTTLVATLTTGDTPLDGRTLEFELSGTEVGTGVTDENGVAGLADVDLAGIDAGEYPDGVRVTFDGDSSYLPAAGTGPLVVAKAEGHVRIINIPSTANVGSSLQPHYSVDGDGQPAVTSQTPSVCTVSGGVVHFQDSGVCALQASVGEGTNHLAATGSLQFVPVVQPSAHIPDTSDDDSDTDDEHVSAGPPATINIEIQPEQQTVGLLVTIIVTVFDEDGNPVEDGTEVSFQVLREEDSNDSAEFLDEASIHVIETENGQSMFEYSSETAGVDTLVVTAGDVEAIATIEWTSPDPSFACVDGFGDPAFERTWARTDIPVRDGFVSRTWMWGPCAFSDSIAEPYSDSPGGERKVRYFDKARMEINDPGGDPNSLWYVTNGLLVVEMITGQRQFGDDEFVDYGPANANVAGDPDDPESPTYSSFQSVLGVSAQPVDTLLIQRIDRDGTVTESATYGEHGVTVGFVDEVTNHGIAAPFWTFMNSHGLVYQGGNMVEEALFENPFYATGRPVTEAYWATVRVDGEYRDVLMQCFERRCLTYTPGNPEGFVVEAGNVGQHYYHWRYLQEPDL